MKDGISPETWFFRYAESFEHLRRVARDHAAKAARGECADALTVASLGCASGAEAYSIAAALEGIIPARIIGIDRSAEELAIARSGRFRPMAVRGPAPAWAREPWSIEEGAVVVRPSLGASIEWIEHDLLDEKLLTRLPRFDVVFCRNVIIYLSEEARTRLGKAITKLLRPGGWLYLGHAEPTSSIGLPWRGRDGAAFAFRAPSRVATPDDETTPRSDANPMRHATHRSESARAPAARRTKPESRAGVAAPKKSRREAARRAPSTSEAARTPRTAADPSIDAIRELADAGRRSEALALARGRHAQGDRGAEFLELLGTLELAEGRSGDAERHLRAALYLDPSRDDAALQLDLIRKRRTPKGRGERS